MAELKNYLLEDYKDTYDWLERVGRGSLSELPPLIISCAITGMNQGKEANINLPETAEEQAQQTYDAYKAGASIVHVHRRSSKNQAVMSNDPEEYKEVNAMIREKCPEIIINNTAACGRPRVNTGGNKGPDGELEWQLSPQLLTTSIYASPEIASIDISNYSARVILPRRKPPLTGRDEDVPWEVAFSITPSDDTLEFLRRVFDAKEVERYAFPEIGQISCLVEIGDGRYELMEPLGDVGVVPKFLNMHGEGFHHISLISSNLEEDCKRLENQGVTLIGKSLEGPSKIAFTHPKSTRGIIYEITER